MDFFRTAAGLASSVR